MRLAFNKDLFPIHLFAIKDSVYENKEQARIPKEKNLDSYLLTGIYPTFWSLHLKDCTNKNVTMSNSNYYTVTDANIK